MTVLHKMTLLMQEWLFALCYGGNSEDSLGGLRCDKYMNTIATNMINVEPQRLSPTGRTAYFHSLRVHYQIRVWKTLDTCVENTVEWGWRLNGMLLPIMTDKEPAPENILVVIRYKCKLSSRNICGTNLCTCCKNVLKCVAVSEGCRGDDCNNAKRFDWSKQFLSFPRHVLIFDTEFYTVIRK